MKYLKEHAKLISIIVIFIVAVVVLFMLYNGVFLNNASKYGDRLKGIEAVKLDSKNKTEIKENVLSLKTSSKVSVTENGKIIEVIIVANDDIDIAKGKELGNKVLEKLTDDQKKYFDVQIYVKKNNKDDKFPIIGYKHHNKDNITWTKDR